MTNTNILRPAVLAAALALAPLAATAQDKISVRMDFAPWGIQAGMHLAEVKGWFKEANLVVDVQDGRGSGNTLQLVNAGQVDVGQIQLGLLAQARENGATVKSFAGFDRRTDLVVLVDKDSPIRKVQDFKGKNLVVFAASPWAPLIDLWLKQGGLDRTTVTVSFVDPAALWGTYTAKRADGLMSTIGSALPVAEKPRPSHGVLAEDAGIAFPSYGLIATEATLKTKADALKRLVATQQKAWAFMRDGGIDEGVEAMLKQRPDARLDRAVQREQIKITIDFFDTPATKGKPIGWQAEEDWKKHVDMMLAAGALKAPAKTSDLYTNDLIQ
ncbi:NitT/TauT family transport system substrate-binding protein [Stella humosa]|uniref:Thiamine pyrimidine synthase n=1 Tax=Stella humosa TaxID=94 RepID=A0A3N1KRX3_9PROT|nr:ABC transporter substrate-binding protein [Stella humosa]ROP83341.1 NitT/TauT family transport system substrate-binding protein [Stella humosa]BBK29875.1 exported protein [Stella humosa]